MKPAPNLLTFQAFYSIWDPFALWQDLAIPCTSLLQRKSSLKDYSLLSPASGCQASLLVGRGLLNSLPLSVSSKQSTWQRPGSWESSRHVQTPKLTRETHEPLATWAMSRTRQELHGSWKPQELSK